VTAIQMKKLMDKGAHIYYYEGGFHHAKSMMVDGIYCTTGSANLDARSLMFDYEINAFMFDKDITNRLQDVYEFDKRSRCMLLTPENFKERFTLRQRAQGRVFSFLKGFL
jgi:cardiolipin synthase